MAREKGEQYRLEGRRLLEVWGVTGLVDQDEIDVAEQRLRLRTDGGRDHPIGSTPDQERRRTAG